MLSALLLVAGLVLLTIAGDRFVLGAARLSTALRVPAVVVGAVIIGFGTSAPELLVSILAALQGTADLGFGNAAGSNIANVLLVLGAAALIAPIAVRLRTLRVELPLMVTAVLAFALVAADGQVTRLSGAALLVGGVGITGLIAWLGLRDRAAQAVLGSEVADLEGPTPSALRAAGLTAIGLAGTLAGAQLVVIGGTGLARAMGVTEAVIGLTVVAIGTSLPELVTAVAASRRREGELAVGNVLGSNIFNSLWVAGAAGALGDATLDPAFRVAVPMMVAAAVLIAVLLFTGRELSRIEGVALLALFALAAAVVW